MEKFSSEIRIMTHNIWGMYDKSIHCIANRNKIMSELYNEYLPGIIGMQECSVQSREAQVDIGKLISPLYTEIDVSADAAAISVQNVFTPIFYMADKFTVIESGFHIYDREYNNSDSKGLTYAVFEEKQTGKKFGVINTHYWWKSGEEHDKARIKNSFDLLDMVKSLESKYNIPVIAMGDLNCRIDSEAFKTLISGGMADAQKSADSTVDISSHHPYPAYNAEAGIYENGPLPKNDYSHAIDHIVISEKFGKNIKRFDIITTQKALDSSDHCPMYIDFSLQELNL